MQLEFIPMRPPRCFEWYCTPVDDFVLLNARFVDPHHTFVLRYRRLLLLIVIICISLLSKTCSYPNASSTVYHCFSSFNIV